MPNNYTNYFPGFINKQAISSLFESRRADKKKSTLVDPEEELNLEYYAKPVNGGYASPDEDFCYQQNNNHLTVVHLVSYPQLQLEIRILKRIFDIIFSLIVMITGFPVFIILYFVTKFTSPGPAFYKQERIGKDDRPFFIYKFRSMYIDAEKLGPQLSSTTDPRVTPWGRVIRSTRLDELPQFWNVLKGDMSVVGPRPERRHFIDQIIEKNSNYRKLQRIKPGVTSMGQVHFGYAENVDQMCERMMFDLHYIQKVNLYTDLHVIAKTVKVMVQRKGK